MIKNKTIKSKARQKHKFMSKISLVICLALVVFGLVLTVSDHAKASLQENSESLIDLNKEKKYKGARDEEELKVLPSVQNSEYGRKKSQESSEGF